MEVSLLLAVESVVVAQILRVTQMSLRNLVDAVVVGEEIHNHNFVLVHLPFAQRLVLMVIRVVLLMLEMLVVVAVLPLLGRRAERVAVVLAALAEISLLGLDNLLEQPIRVAEVAAVVRRVMGESVVVVRAQFLELQHLEQQTLVVVAAEH